MKRDIPDNAEKELMEDLDSLRNSSLVQDISPLERIEIHTATKFLLQGYLLSDDVE